MRKFIIASLVVTLGFSASAAEMRTFDVKTTERLGNELTRASQRADHGANTSVMKLARGTGMAALKPRLPNARYEFVVLNDPKIKGFLVYALMQAPRKDDLMFGGHYRISVSADGSKAGPVEAIQPYVLHNLPPPGGGHPEAFATVDMDHPIPVETFLYSSNLYHEAVMVGTKDKAYWLFYNGRMHKLTKTEMESIEKGKGI
jgi:hypothetical protein